MVYFTSYGSLDAAPARALLPLVPAGRARLMAALLFAVAVVLLVVTKGRSADQSATEMFYTRFPRVPTLQLSWDGCGAGGDCGSRYHWTSHSFSPVQERHTETHPQ